MAAIISSTTTDIGNAVVEVDIDVPFVRDPNATYRNFTTILDHHPEYFFFKLSFNVPFGILILVANAMTIHAIRKFSTLRTVTNVFIQSLSMADILNSVPIMVLRLLIFIKDRWWSNVAHMIVFTFLALSPSLSLYSHAALAFDRYMAVVHPLHYRQRITRECAKTVTIVIWVFDIAVYTILTAYFWRQAKYMEIEFRTILHIPLVLPPELYYGLIVPQTVIFLSMCIILYTTIFITIKIRIIKTNEQVKDHTRSHEDLRARRAAKTTAIVLLVLLICWTPFSLLTGFLDIQKFYTVPLWFILYEISVYLFYLIGLINPIIYWCRLQDFKTAYTSMIRRE